MSEASLSPPPGRMSVRAYARYRGLKSDNAVRAAIQSGRIERGPDGLIDVAQADIDWTVNTDTTHHSRAGCVAKAPKNKPKGAAATEDAAADTKRSKASAHQVKLASEILRRHGRQLSGGDRLTNVDARTAETLQKMEDRQIDMDAKRGLLVNKSNAMAKIFDAARKERDAWLQWVPRIVSEMAAELKAKGSPVDPQILELTLERYVRNHLSDLAGPGVEL